MKLVFLHGAGGSSLEFFYQTRHFGNSKALDLPGHPSGMSSPSIYGYMEWVRGFVAARRYKDIVLCGHSMGGAVCLLYALRHPEELRAIILVSTGARLKVHPKILKWFESMGYDKGPWLHERKATFDCVEPDVRRSLLQRASETGPEAQLNDLRACDDFDVMDQVNGIRLPTHIISGSQDVMTPVKYSDYLAREISGATQEVIPGAGHYVQMESHRRVNESIERFLAALKR